MTTPFRPGSAGRIVEGIANCISIRAVCPVVAFLFVATATIAVPLQQGDGVQLPAGVRLRPPRGFEAALPRPPQVFLYETQKGERLEAIDPVSQWQLDQLIATFTGDAGTITLARMRYAPLQNLNLIAGKHMQRSEYQKAIAAATPVRNASAFAQWVQAWTGASISESETKVHGMTLRTPFLRYFFTGALPDQDQAWLLDQAQGPLLVRFQLHGLDASDTERTISAVLRSISETRAEPTIPAAAVPTENALAAARADVAVQISNTPGWWAESTPNYVIASNLDKRAKTLVELLQRNIEIIRNGYQALFPPVKPITTVSVVRVFADTDAYKNYVSPDMKWTSGVWDPSRKELVIAGDKSSSSRELRDNVLSTAWHEAFHQYLFYALDFQDPPIWLNEGHACLFETCEIDTVRRRMRIRDNENRRQWLMAMLKDRPQNADLSRLLTMSREQFYVAGQDGKDADILRSDNYTLAWALAWFIHKAGPLYSNPSYQQIIPATLKALAETGDTKKAAQAGLLAADLPALQRDFQAFWQDARMQSKAERTQILPGL